MKIDKKKKLAGIYVRVSFPTLALKKLQATREKKEFKVAE